jgi:phosphatidyl-myo-inositol dimannoside synthase
LSGQRIVFIASDFVPNVGGLARFIYQLVKHLPPEWVTAVATPIPGWQTFDAQQLFPIHRLKIPETWYPFNRQLKFLSPLYLYHLLRLPRPGVVLCAHGNHALLLAAWLHRVIRGTPYGVFLHGYDSLHLPHSRWPAYYRALLCGADRVYANSQLTHEGALAAGVDPARLHIIHPCVDAELTRPAPPSKTLRMELGLDNCLCVLTVSRLVERKGVQQVIRAMAEVKTAVPQAHHLIVGDGPYRPTLEELAATLGLNAQTTFLGEKSHTEVATYYTLCDLFVMVNDVESFGLVFLEANLAGKAVVGPRLPGVIDAVMDGQTGLLVDPHDPSATAQAIVTLLRDKTLAERMGENGRRRVLNDFTCEKAAEKLLATLTPQQTRP